MTKKKVRKLKTAQGSVTKPTLKATTTGEVKEESHVVKADSGSQVKTGTFKALIQYFREVRGEFDKITWANRKETVSMTIAVLAISMFFASYLGLVDIALSKLVGILMG